MGGGLDVLGTQPARDASDALLHPFYGVTLDAMRANASANPWSDPEVRRPRAALLLTRAGGS